MLSKKSGDCETDRMALSKGSSVQVQVTPR